MTYEIPAGARCTVIGSGSWATAIVKMLLENERKVGWYVRRAEDVEYILENGTNPKYLRDVHFDTTRLEITDDINAAVASAEVVILATPSAFIQSVLEGLTVPLKDKFVVSAIKGIVPDSLLTIAEYVNRDHGVPFDRIGVITGPCHSEEVALERLSYLTMVCKDIENSRTLGEKLSSKYINVTYSTDIYGTEYAAVLKNIYAIGVGIAIGLGYGDNFMAVLISNSALEMDRFLAATYPAERNTDASAYLGDLLVTSYSQFSRNRTLGVMVGKGYTVQSAQIEMSQVAEGYYAADCIARMNAKYGIDMPIATAVHSILYKNASPRKTIKELTAKLI